jgi:colanic acid biosynthesis glycosyl transferase WcaI
METAQAAVRCGLSVWAITDHGRPARCCDASSQARAVGIWVLDLLPETLQAIGVIRSRVLLQAVGKLVAFIYRRCDLILAQSKSFIPQIRKYAVKDSRVKYFPSWAESVFDMQRAVPADEVPLKPGSFNLMFAGNIGDAQDFPAILAAAKSLKAHAHIRWLIVGDGRMARGLPMKSSAVISRIAC